MSWCRKPTYQRAKQPLTTSDGVRRIAETGTLDSHEVIVNWGDGTAATTLSIPAGTSTFTLNHDYAAGGDYLTGRFAITSQDNRCRVYGIWGRLVLG